MDQTNRFMFSESPHLCSETTYDMSTLELARRFQKRVQYVALKITCKYE